MSYESVEKALYDLNVDRRARTLLAEDPVQFVERYRLTEDEAEAMLEMDVRKLADGGWNPMLVWGYWMTCSQDRSVGSYLARLRQSSAAAEEL